MSRRSVRLLLSSSSLNALAIATAVLIAPGLAHGQAASGQAQQAQAAGGGSEIALGTLLVEDRAGVDYTTNVFSGTELEALGLSTVEQVLRLTPGVNVNSSGGTNLSTIYVRGVGSMYPMNLNDGAVPMAIDGAPVSARHMSLGTLDVDSVDILKGPQGTTSGVSGLGGVIDVTTRRPTRVLEGYGRVEYGEQGQSLLEAAVGGPMGDALSGRLAVRFQQSDHWVTNAANGEPLSSPSDLAFRAHLLWDAGKGTSALLTVEHENVDELPNLLILRPYGNPPSVNLTPGLYDGLTKSFDRYALQVNHDLDIGRLTSISSYVNSSNTEIAAYDANIMTAQYGSPSQYWSQDEASEAVYTQDLRLSSLPNSALDWVAGMFFQHADGSYNTPLNSYGANTPSFRNFTTDTYAIYGDVTVPLTDALKLTLGLRQNWNTTSYDGTFLNWGTLSGDSRSLSETATTGRAMLTYALTGNTELRAKYARGYTPGGFNIYATQVADGEPFEGAINDMIEVGFTTQTADHRFALSGAAYVNWVSDNHLLSYNSATYVVSAVNADTRSQGFEVQGQWRPGNGFALSVGLSYVDATITSSVYGAGEGDILAGNGVPDVSPWSALIQASYETALPPFLGLSNPMLKSLVSYSYVGARPADPQNNFNLDSYQKLDVHVGIAQGQTEVYLRADNLLDDMYELYGYYNKAAGISYGGVARGRTFIAGLSHRF